MATQAKLTLALLKKAARDFARKLSETPTRELYGVTDGKAGQGAATSAREGPEGPEKSVPSSYALHAGSYMEIPVDIVEQGSEGR